MINRFKDVFLLCFSSLSLLLSSSIAKGFPLDHTLIVGSTLPSKRRLTLATMAAESSTATESLSPRSRDNKKNPAPFYITIGPQCCGKTTLLKDIDDGLQDVCLDDQLDVYVSIATQQWLDLLKMSPNPDEIKEGESTIPEELQQQVQGKTLAQRIQNDNPELNLILKRWNGDLSATEFADAISQHYTKNVNSRNQRNSGGNPTPNVAEVLIPVVEDFLSKDDRKLPAKTDVFCLESLFKPHTKTNQSAIQAAHAVVKTASPEIPLAWGNTNAKAKDFQQVLDIAYSTKRPVHFVLCHPTWKLEDDKYNIPWVELSTLLSRNLQRLEATGRYIPANSIADCCQRIQDQLIPSDCKSSGDVEQALVHQSTQPVRRHDKPLPFRYRLTREHLIHKEYPERRPPQQRRRQDQRREYRPSKDQYSSRGRPPPQQQQRHQYNDGPPRQDRSRDYDQQRQHRRGPPQDDRRYDNRRRYEDEDRCRRRGGYNDDGYYARGGGGRGEDRRRSEEGQPPPRGKRGYSDQDRRDGNYDDNKRYRR
mmetsp:Transcript_8034/g.19419  ORF Transcript_8034/g.19419 Transcript_8034/m.19419 type:complete len:535 (+) Transcript_8034:83-1687(+)